MLSSFTSKLVLWALKTARINGEDKTKVMAHLLKNIGALPLTPAFTVDVSGAIVLNGKTLDMEQTIGLRSSASALQQSSMEKVLNEQMRFLAIQMGVHHGLNPEMIMFSKAALWVIQEREKVIQQIAIEDN